MRKIIAFVVAIFTALAAVLQSELGLTIGIGAAMVSLLALATYIFGEAKNDLARVKAAIVQGGKWTDPTFWGAILAGLLPVVNAQFKLGLTAETISVVCTVVVGLLGIVFKRRQSTIPTL